MNKFEKILSVNEVRRIVKKMYIKEISSFNQLFINQVKISNCLRNFHRIKTIYGLQDYNKLNKPCLFFGVYNKKDLNFISKHRGNKYILWGGTDLDPRFDKTLDIVKCLKNMKNVFHIAISDNISERLQKYNIKHYIFKNFSLIDKNLFKPTKEKGNKIYIYNGVIPGREPNYGKEIYEKVMEKLPQFEFIQSNKLNISYQEIHNIYKECFIGLRLTEYDGNANTVQEFKSMGIPIIHNHSEYGLKWKNVDDIVNHIQNNRKILIYADININNTDGAVIWLSNLTNTLIKDGYKVDILNSYVKNYNNFMRNVEKKESCNIYKISRNSPKKKIQQYYRYYDKIIIRGSDILNELNNDDEILNKICVYAMGIHQKEIVRLNNNFMEIWCQSKTFEEIYTNLGIPKNKIKLTPPIAYKYNFNIPERRDKDIRLIYCGTLRDEENILEIIEQFKKIHSERSEIKLTICYGKIHGNYEFVNKINDIIEKGVKGITFKYNLSHRDSCYEIATSDIGICWRKNGWGDNGEISTKILEYELYNLPVLVNFNNWKYKLSLVNNFTLKSDVINTLMNYNTPKYDTLSYEILKVSNIKINFIIFNLSTIKKRNGSINNELTIMTFLSKYFKVYYNDVLINEFVFNDVLDVDMLNKHIEKKINKSKLSDFFPNYYGIFKFTQKYDITFYRCDNFDYLKKLFKMLPEPKVFSHNYDQNIWENNNVGFQTNVSKYLALNNTLKYIEDDGTLKYYKNQMVVPKKTFVKPSFIKNYVIEKVDLHSKLNSKFLISVIGNINKHTNINNLISVVQKLRNKYQNLNICIVVFSNENYEEKHNHEYIHYFNLNENVYFNYLSDIDVCVNTWYNNVIIYSSSNKILDCVSLNVPIIVPHSISYYEMLGLEYPLYYSYKNLLSSLENCIEGIITKRYNDKVNKLYNVIKDKYNINSYKTYFHQILNVLTENIKKINIIIIGVGSGKRNFGGISVNTEQMYFYFKNNGFLVNAILYDNKIEAPYTLYDNNFVHCNNKYVYNFINKFKRDESIIILQSWIHSDVINYLKKHNMKIVMLNPGLLLDTLDTFYLNLEEKDVTFSDVTLNTIQNADIVVANSKLSQNMIKNKLNINPLLNYFNSYFIKKYDICWENKTYDVGFVISSTKRSIKNFNLFVKILEKLDNLYIIIVGHDTHVKINNHKIEVIKHVDNETAINIIADTKILVNTSFFDCGPTTLFESILNKSKYICSNNVGGSELLNENEIVVDYNNIYEWGKKISDNLTKEPIRDYNKINSVLNINNLLIDILR